MTAPRQILVVAPHGLDELLGCAGVVARHVEAGDRVAVVVLAGDGSGADGPRRDNGRRAAALLGTAEPRFAGFPENRTDTLGSGELIGWLERQLGELKPELLYVPHAGNLNIDHQRTHLAAITAARPVPGQSVRTILAYETPSSTDWAVPSGTAPFMPVHFVDIAAAWPKKRAALELYASDLRPPPHARSLEAIEALAVHRGHGVGLAKAEAFMVLRDVPR